MTIGASESSRGKNHTPYTRFPLAVGDVLPAGALEDRPKDAVGERGTGNRLHFRQPPSGLGSSPGVGGPHLGPRLVHVRLPGPPLPHRLDDVGRPGLTPERLGQFPPTLRVAVLRPRPLGPRLGEVVGPQPAGAGVIP